MSKTRTFVAIAASSEIRSRAKAAISQLRSSDDHMKWVDLENMHWTLQFLGDVGDVEVAEVCHRVAQIAEQHKPFPLVASGLGAFPSIDRPRAVWLGAEQGADGLCTLQDAVEEGMADLGFRGERRRYIPHITLGRIGRGSHGSAELSQQVDTMANFDGGTMVVDQVRVYGSEMERKGPTYHVLSRASLSGRG